ncbi:MAG: TonB-dependent receptor [Bacteroidaceae bacterium]|nr:TonB-dependent receptor [Bacteroidaceae bacterium]
MKRFVLLALLVGISSVCLSAQNRGQQSRTRGTVSGTVIDKEDNSAVMSATVQLLSLPDSTMVTGNVTNTNGYFSLSARPGKYVLKISFVGYLSYLKEIQLTSAKPSLNVGKVLLGSDAVMLKEAVITAEAPQVTVSGDTLGYSASAYRTSEGAMLEELVKKLPGAEVDDDGNVKINGKEVKKLMVDGKEFFGGDVKTGLQNLPVNMIEKINAYDRQSDNARITGIDDGEEETVLDLTVKKGMNQGWIGNFDLGGGTEDRYSLSGNINRFASGGGKSSQFSLIGRVNNVNDRRFGGGGGPMWRRNNGLTTSKEVGGNYAMETEKFEFGASVRYNYRDNDVRSIGQVENFLPTGNSSFANSRSASRTKNDNLNAHLRMEWRPDSLTTFFMRGGLSWGKTESASESLTATFNSDPYAVVIDPNKFLDFDSEANEELDKIRVNASDNGSMSESKSLSANGNMQLTRKLNDKGRNVTLRLIGSYSDGENDRFSNTQTRYYIGGDGIPTFNEDTIRRYITTPTNNYNLGTEVSYSEPLADRVYLQFSYRFQYGYSESDNSTYNMPFGWVLSDGLPGQFSQHQSEWLDPEQSKYAEYKRFNHDARVTFRVNRQTWRLSAGVALRPQNTKLSYKKGDFQTDTTRNVFNFSPEVDFRYQPQRQTQLRFSYRGRTSDPSMENLLPITDNSNPLDIRTGNPGLKPSFTHNMNMHFNTFNMDKQRGIFSALNGSFTQNAISNIRKYNEATGGWTTMPENINGNWNVFGMFGMNTALKNKKFTIDTFTNASYNNNVGYVTTGEMKDAQKNTTTNLSLDERVGGRYRNDWLEIGLNGSLNYTFEKDKLNPENNQEPYTFSYGGNVQIYAPWGTTISTNMTNQARRGYSDTSMNRNELIWNAQIAQSFLKGALTLSFEWNDILREQSNITRSLTSSGRSVYTYNGVNSYGMVRLIYRLNIFGSKEAREAMQNRRGPGMGGPGMGGRGGMRGPGGPGRRPF